MNIAVKHQHPPATSDGLSLADLERLRLGLPGCEVALLADISAGTVLGVSAALNLPQEHFDGLCDQATRVLSHGGEQRAFGVVASPKGVRLYVRAPDFPEEALGLVLPPSFDLQVALAHTLAVLIPNA